MECRLKAKKCGGCPMLGLDYAEQLKQKEAAVRKLVGKYGPVAPIRGAENPCHYRNKVISTFAAGPGGKLVSGIYAAGTHKVLPVESCLLQDEVLDTVMQARALAAALPGKNVLFAFALSAGHREADRVVSIDLKKITIGQLPGAISNKQLIGRIFHGTKYKVVYEPNMEDYLLCHAAFVMPAAFACYKTDGDLKKLRRNTVYLGRVIDANIEGYRAIRNAGHDILPKADADFESEKYRKTCLRFFKLMCATSLGKLCASDHAMNAIDEMSALNRDIKRFFDENGAAYPVWQALEAEAGRYLR